MQMVELHYHRQPTCDYSAVKARAQEILKSELGSSEPGETGRAVLLYHKQRVVQYTDAQVPVATSILATDEPPTVDAYTQEIQQSWRCRDAEELLRPCTATRLVTEMMARSLSPQDRLLLFHGVLQAMVEVTTPNVLVFKHSQQVVTPDDYLSACTEEPIFRPGSVNVRFFNIANSEGNRIMDTCGLEAIGLHDLQCHFRNLDPNEVSRVLYNLAVYIFENGPVIESGHTVEGTPPGSRWRCQFEESLLEPKRTVLDLNPGTPDAAGNR